MTHELAFENVNSLQGFANLSQYNLLTPARSIKAARYSFRKLLMIFNLSRFREHFLTKFTFVKFQTLKVAESEM